MRYPTLSLREGANMSPCLSTKYDPIGQAKNTPNTGLLWYAENCGLLKGQTHARDGCFQAGCRKCEEELEA